MFLLFQQPKSLECTILHCFYQINILVRNEVRGQSPLFAYLLSSLLVAMELWHFSLHFEIKHIINLQKFRTLLWAAVLHYCFFSSCEELFPIAAVPLVYFYFSCLCFGAFGVMYKAMLPQSTSHSLPSVFFCDFYGVIFYVYGSHSFDVVSIYSARYLWCLILCFN